MRRQHPTGQKMTRRARLTAGGAVLAVAVVAGLLAAAQLRDETAWTGSDRGSQDGRQSADPPEPDASGEVVDAPGAIAPSEPPGPGGPSAKGDGTGVDKGDRPNGGAGAKEGDATTEPGTSWRAADPAGWRTLWRDDFTGLDRTRWNVRHYGQAPNQAALFMRENVKVDDGFLHLRAKKQVVQRWNYTSGYIDSNGKAALPDEFRVEVRAKVPMERGLWPGPLWLRPDDRSAGEIDLVEIFGRELDDPATHHTIHTAYGPGREQAVQVKKFSELPGTADGWHTYSMEKTPGSIKMWVDDVPVATFTSGDPSWFDTYYEVGKRWNLRVTLNVGGEWNGMPDHTTDWSASESVMHLDYIHTWVRD